MINIIEIRTVLANILTTKISREDAANWALNLREKLGDHNKEFEDYSLATKKIIWDALIFIEGIDLKDSPDSYLYNENDVINMLKKTFPPHV